MKGQHGYLLGLDVGSSSVKAALVDIASGMVVAQAQSPNEEMPIVALNPGWAEQAPDQWWTHVVRAVRSCVDGRDARAVRAIGIGYQMHGLVAIDDAMKPVRPAIIWCDSRAISIGEKIFEYLGADYCLGHLLNSPGNFTGSKLKWVQQHEPSVYKKIWRMMLPGDYVAMRLTGEVQTTATGLSEGVLWDFKNQAPAQKLIDHFGFDSNLICPQVDVFSQQGTLSAEASAELGLTRETIVSYRAGDQPNNAFALGALAPGDVAANAGTSGVIYAVTDLPVADPQSRVNTFLHVNHQPAQPRNGVLLCVNGAGILNSWLRKNTSATDYPAMNTQAAQVEIGSDGLSFLPFGNGAERMLGNKSPQASLHGLDLNRHGSSHLYRAAQEGIAFAFRYGLDVLTTLGLRPRIIKAGETNLFLSPVFREAFVHATGVKLELYDTNGSIGAARGAGVGAGIYSLAEAQAGLHKKMEITPDPKMSAHYEKAYAHWKELLNAFHPDK